MRRPFPTWAGPNQSAPSFKPAAGVSVWSTYWPATAIGTGRLPDGIEAALVGGWEGVRTAYALSDVHEMAAAVREPTYFVGELPAALREQLQAILGQHARLGVYHRGAETGRRPRRIGLAPPAGGRL